MNYVAISYIHNKDIPDGPVGKFVKLVRQVITQEYFKRKDVLSLDSATALLAYPFPSGDGKSMVLSVGLKYGRMNPQARNFSPDLFMQLAPTLDATRTTLTVETTVHDPRPTSEGSYRTIMIIDLLDPTWHDAITHLATKIFENFVRLYTTGKWATDIATVLVKERDPKDVH